MTYATYKTHRTYMYKDLKTYQNATIIYDFTVEYCRRYVDYKSRTKDQMEQAARSGKQNITEGCEASKTSKKTEMKLLGVAYASLKELAEDYEDYLRQHNLSLWDKDSEPAKAVRTLAYTTHKTYATYRSYMDSPEQACNAMFCLINQTTYMLQNQIKALKKQFLEEGDFAENLTKARLSERAKQNDYTLSANQRFYMARQEEFDREKKFWHDAYKENPEKIPERFK